MGRRRLAAAIIVRLLYYVGLQAAGQPTLPQWNAGDEFEAARKAAIKAVKL